MLLNKPPGSAEQEFHTHEYADGKVAFNNVGSGLATQLSEQEQRNFDNGLMSTQDLLGHRYMDAGQLAGVRAYSIDNP